MSAAKKKAGESFPCPNGCGDMVQMKCKLRCEKCGYFDSCADFC